MIMILDHNGEPFKTEYNYWGMGILQQAYVSLKLKEFAQPLDFPWKTLLVDQFGNPIPRIGAPKTVKFRRYNNVND